MNCPRCGYKIAGRLRRCENCGQDLRPLEELLRLSNRLYNEGLAEARVRNLSAACGKLKRSLEYNKENIDARNLLGLVYYEMGETVAAIVEWVISTNLRKADNPADILLEKLQGDAGGFRDMKSAIKKFNIALDMANKGNDDLAILQLKKVTDLNDHYVKAFLLLALLQMKHGDYASAKKNLKRVLKIDVGNLDARRYIAELRSLVGDKGRSSQPDNDDQAATAVPFGMSGGTHYKEDKPNIAAIVMFILGLVVGVFVIRFFAVNGIREKLLAENAESTRRMGVQITELTSKVVSMENDEVVLKSSKEFTELCLEFEKVRAMIEEENGTVSEDEVKSRTEELYRRLIGFDISKTDGNTHVSELYESMKAYISSRVQIK